MHQRFDILYLIAVENLGLMKSDLTCSTKFNTMRFCHILFIQKRLDNHALSISRGLDTPEDFTRC